MQRLQTAHSAQAQRASALAPIALAAILAVTLGSIGCSSYESDWRAAAPLDEANHPVLGRWRGTWRSGSNDHTGGLRAIVTRLAPGKYEARYHATWAGFLSGEFKAPLDGKLENGVYSFTSEQDLGAWGAFEATGQADGKLFRADFKSNDDHGVFEMTRP